MMENVQKYFIILESLNTLRKFSNDLDKIKSNTEIIRKYVKADLCVLSEELGLKTINYNSDLNNTSSDDYGWTYSSLLYHILLTIKSQINLNSNEKEELISLVQLEHFSQMIIDASKYGIRPNLLLEIQDHQIFKLNGVRSEGPNYSRLLISLNFIEQIFQINNLVSGNKLDEVKLDSMAAAISIISSKNVSQDDKNKVDIFLKFLWDHSSKVKYFRNLLILKSIKKLPVSVQTSLHEDLLGKLQNPFGFRNFQEAIMPATLSETPNWKCFEIVANIIGHKGHISKFYNNMIAQILEFLKNSCEDDELKNYIPGGVLSLRKLYFLNDNLKIKIRIEIEKFFTIFTNPDDVLTGTILVEHKEFEDFLNFLNFSFCGSSLQSLPSEILIDFLPLLLQLHYQIPEGYRQQNEIKNLIIQCLSNREKPKLKEILEDLLLQNVDNKYKLLNSRINLNVSEQINVLTAQICAPDLIIKCDFTSAICNILKSSNNNILIYNAFISVLCLFEEENLIQPKDLPQNDRIDLLMDQEEFDNYLEKKFKSRFAFIIFLTDLIEFQPLRTQFKENSEEILGFIKTSLKKYVESDNLSSNSDEKLSITLAIFLEITENSEDFSKFISFEVSLKKLLVKTKNDAIKHQIENILLVLGEDNIAGKKKSSFEKSEYNIARTLIEDSQPYLRVYGISSLIKLINEKDNETISNKHSILALTLLALKDEESYTFLNCIKLFVSLMKILESEVLEVLADEYLSDNNLIDFRLKIGEAILKVTEELGPLSYNYKGILINCFLSGCTHPLNEFRFSSLSNLGTVCRLLTYQVHNFFQELLNLIESILETEKYLPAKRAAVLVLTQLLSGMDNLIDFQEFLLPIYRILKILVAQDTDEIVKVHASNGLKVLGEKCKSMLMPEQDLIKEIKIFGIKDNVNKKSGHILELN